MTSLPSPGSPVKSLSGDERSMNHKLSAFSVLQLWVSQGSTDTGKVAFTVSEASPLEGSLSPQAFVKSFEVTESLGRKEVTESHWEVNVSMLMYFDVVFFFGISLMFGSMGRLNEGTKTHLETFAIYRHIIVSMKLGLWRVWKNTKWFQKNMSCFYFDRHDLATLILIVIIFHYILCFDLFDFPLGLFWFPPSTERANVPGRHLLLPHPRKHSCPRCLSSGKPEFHPGKAGEPGRFE